MTKAAGVHARCPWAVRLASRLCFAAALCLALLVPATSTLAADVKDSADLRHGSVEITCDAASDDNVITLAVGESAEVVVTPYGHVQYTGCGKQGCPDRCEEEHEEYCFVQGMGCRCDMTPIERYADVSTAVADEGIVSVSGIVADDTWTNANNYHLSDSTKPVTKNGTITLIATAAGTTTVTVVADTNQDGLDYINYAQTTLLAHWYETEATFTVVVEDDADAEDGTGDIEDGADAGNDAIGDATDDDARGDAGGDASGDTETDALNGADADDATEVDAADEGAGTVEAGTEDVASGSGDDLDDDTTDSAAASIASAKVTLSFTRATYTGKVRKPTVKVVLGGVTLAKGSDYTLTYSEGCKAIGAYGVTVTGTGSYSGHLTRTFTIRPAKVTLKSVKAGKRGSRKLTVKWKTTAAGKKSGAKYQVAYKKKGATGWSYKTVSAKTCKKVLEKLKKGKKYQVKVRAYKKASNQTYYGTWSKVKAVKVK